MFFFTMMATTVVLTAIGVVTILAWRYVENFYMRRAITRAIVRRLPLFLAAIIILGISNCGGGNSQTTPPPNVTPTPVSIIVAPNTATIVPLAKQQFEAAVLMSDGSTTSKGVAFTASGQGQIDSSGLFTASSVPGSATVTANAGNLFQDATVQITAPTSAGPQYVQATSCGKGSSNACTLNVTAGDALVFFLYSETIPYGPVTLTDSQNDQLVTIGHGSNPSNVGVAEFGIAGIGTSSPLVGGQTTIVPPSGTYLLVAEYSGATDVDDLSGDWSINSGAQSGSILNWNYVSQNPNATVIEFALSDISGSIDAGASSTQRYQEENSDAAIMLEDQAAPTPAQYRLSFAFAPAVNQATQTVVIVMALK